MGAWMKDRQLKAVSETGHQTAVLGKVDPSDLRPLIVKGKHQPRLTPDRSRTDLPCTKVGHRHLVRECS